MVKVLVKIHKAYREIIAVCDSDLIGRKFEEGNMQLEVDEQFYGGDEMSESQIIKLLRERAREDSCFNFVGKASINLAIKAGVIEKDKVIEVQGIQHAMTLL